jgi:hypothetical protein
VPGPAHGDSRACTQMASFDAAAAWAVLTLTAAVARANPVAAPFRGPVIVQKLRESSNANAAAAFQTLAIAPPQLWRNPAKDSHRRSVMELHSSVGVLVFFRTGSEK